MLKNAIILGFYLLFAEVASAQNSTCIQTLSAEDRAEIAFFQEAMADSRVNEAQLREAISKRFDAMSPAARIALYASVSRWNFNLFVSELRQHPALIAAFNEFNAAFDLYQQNRARFAGGQWEAETDQRRVELAQEKFIEALEGSALGTRRKAFIKSSLQSAVEGLRRQGEQSLAEGRQFTQGLQTGALIAGGVAASAGLIWVSVMTGGMAAPAAGVVTSATGTALLSLVSGATGSMGTVGIVGAVSITGNAVISSQANEEDFFCSLAQQTSEKGPLILRHSIEAAALGGIGAGGLALMPLKAGTIVGGTVAVGGTAAMLTHAGMRAAESGRMHQQADVASAAGQPARAHELHTEAQRVALEAGLESAATVAGAVPAVGSISSRVLRARVIHQPVIGARLRLDTLPGTLRESAAKLDFESPSSEALERNLANLIVNHLRKKGVAAELCTVENRLLVKVIPTTAKLANNQPPHWLNSQAAQLAKESPGHVLAFDPSLPMDSVLQGTAYYDPRAGIMALPLSDLEASKMGEAGTHEWIHYLHAKANGKGELYRGQAQVNVRPLRPSLQAKVRQFQLPTDYRAFHSLDEVFAYLKNAQLNLKSYEKVVADLEAKAASPTTETLNDVNEIYAVLQDSRMRVETIGEYDTWVLQRVLRDLIKDQAKLVDISQGEYPVMGHEHVLVLARDNAISVAKALLSESLSTEVITGAPVERLVTLLQSQLATVARARADAKAIGARADTLHSQFSARVSAKSF